jgi:predicted amidohydrolase
LDQRNNQKLQNTVMKICVAQTKSSKGDIKRNVAHHLHCIDLAAAAGAGTIVFPELSITGYEPTLAKELAMTLDDQRLDDFQHRSDARQITIGVGAPITITGGLMIGMVIFQPQQARQLYTKQYLHPDEEPFFVSGTPSTGLMGALPIALAICYETSVPAHSERAFQSGAQFYLASVIKSPSGMEKASIILAEGTKKYGIPVLLSNGVGMADGDVCGGKTSVWNKQGVLIGQLNEQDEGLLIYDSETEMVTVVKV